MFQRKGRVLVEQNKPASDKGEIVLEELVDLAFAAGADDFDDVLESGAGVCMLKAS